MEAIANLSGDIARSIEGVCFDIDDTVTEHGVLDASAYAALFALKNAGLTVFAVTGRPLAWAEIVARMWPVDAAIGENGAGYVAKRGETVDFGFWDDEATRREQTVRLAHLRARVAYEMPQVRESSDAWGRRCDLAFDVNEYASLTPAEIEQLSCLLRREGAFVTVSSVHAHAQFGNHDKAQGFARAAQMLLGIDAAHAKSRFMFVGDSGNDAAAFEWFDVSAGVANVTHHLARLPMPPRYVAQAAYGPGFAEIVSTLLARRSA